MSLGADGAQTSADGATFPPAVSEATGPSPPPKSRSQNQLPSPGPGPSLGPSPPSKCKSRSKSTSQSHLPSPGPGPVRFGVQVLEESHVTCINFPVVLAQFDRCKFWRNIMAPQPNILYGSIQFVI